ncbi:MAG: translation elongation factor Ts [Bacillota bacterium]
MISASTVKELREKTGAGMMDCKRALEECAGDLERAVIRLREQGLAAAVKKAARVANQGLVHSYIHGGGRLGVLVEVNCETDFVARNAEFQSFVHDMAMQVGAARPDYVSRDEVPAEVLTAEQDVYRQQALAQGKPAAVVEKMVEGRLDKFLREVCLLEQPFIKDPERSVRDVLTDTIAKTGENIAIRRFVRWEIGEGE